MTLREGNTNIGGKGNAFPRTCWTVIRDSADPTSPQYQESMDRLAGLYWRPIYAYFRRKWGISNEEAKDLTQDFFLQITQKDFLEKVSKDRGRFRTYVRVSLDNFARLRYRKNQAQKRGGQIAHVSIEPENAPPSTSPTPEEVFMKEWAQTTIDDALSALETEFQDSGKSVDYQLFHLRVIEQSVEEDTRYETLAERFGISKSDVRNSLYRTRKRLKDLVRERVRATVSNETEAIQEMTELFAHL